MSLDQRRTLPASACYWAVIEPSAVASSQRSRGQVGIAREYLDALIADELPVPIEDVHTVYARAADASIIACAIDRSRLTELKGDALRLTPESLPEFVAGREVDPDELNLLVGAFEPAPLVRERGRARVALVAAAIAMCVLASIGLLRRAGALDREALANDARALSAARASLSAAAPSSGNASFRPLEVTLSTALFQLREQLGVMRATRSLDPRTSPDASAPLAALLASMPKAESLRTDSLSVNANGISLNLATDHDPQAILARLAAPNGFALTEPRYSTTPGGTTQLAIQMRPVPAGHREQRTDRPGESSLGGGR